MTEYRTIYLPYRAKYMKEHGKDILDAFHKTPEYIAYEERKNALAAEKKEAKAKAKAEKKVAKEVAVKQEEVEDKPKADIIRKVAHNKK